jgi:NTE family protein
LLRIEYGIDQRLNDSNDINGKAFEVSTRTIKDLIKQGCEDTLKYETELSQLF